MVAGLAPVPDQIKSTLLGSSFSLYAGVMEHL